MISVTNVVTSLDDMARRSDAVAIAHVVRRYEAPVTMKVDGAADEVEIRHMAEFEVDQGAGIATGERRAVVVAVAAQAPGGKQEIVMGAEGDALWKVGAEGLIGFAGTKAAPSMAGGAFVITGDSVRYLGAPECIVADRPVTIRDEVKGLSADQVFDKLSSLRES